MQMIVITLVLALYHALPIVAMDTLYFSKALDFSEPGYTGLKIFETIFGVSIRTCIESCKLRQRCDYINYFAGVHLCLILTSDGSSNPQIYTGVGMLYGSKAEWNMTGYQACDTCSENATCVLTGSVSSCTFTGCGPPVVPPGISMLGNLYNVGSRLLFRCDHNHSIATSVDCMPDGTWSEPGISCESSSPTTAVPIVLFNCTSSNYGEMLTYMLQDGTDLTIWLSPNRTTIPNANATCRNLGGRLVKLSTQERFDAIVEIINCATTHAGGNYDWYIDATYDGDGSYLTEDGDTIPTALLDGTNFNKPCMKMKKGSGHLLEHDVCDHDHEYICELYGE